jgi:hypothetical protein
MSKKSILAVTAAIQLALLVFTPGLKLAFASSYDDFGISGSLEGPDYSSGTCEIFTGPRQLSARANAKLRPLLGLCRLDAMVHAIAGSTPCSHQEPRYCA